MNGEIKNRENCLKMDRKFAQRLQGIQMELDSALGPFSFFFHEFNFFHS